MKTVALAVALWGIFATAGCSSCTVTEVTNIGGAEVYSFSCPTSEVNDNCSTGQRIGHLHQGDQVEYDGTYHMQGLTGMQYRIKFNHQDAIVASNEMKIVC